MTHAAPYSPPRSADTERCVLMHDTRVPATGPGILADEGAPRVTRWTSDTAEAHRRGRRNNGEPSPVCPKMKSPIDVERVRVSAERIVSARVGAFDDRYSLSESNTALRRRDLRSRALLLTPAIAPVPCAAAELAMERLGLDDTIELYQSDGGVHDNASAVLFGNPVGVEFHGGFLASLDGGQLLAVLGHEIGHVIAHLANPRYAWARSTPDNAFADETRALLMAGELTADRFGLLACRDLDAALRLELRSLAGRSAPALALEPRAYLESCRALVEETIANQERSHGSSHPEHSVRAYAAWLFSETDLYRSITGAGPATRTVEEVDGVLASLLAVRSSEARPRPSSLNRVVRRPPAETRPRDALLEGARTGMSKLTQALGEVGEALVPAMKHVAAVGRALSLRRSERSRR